MSDKTYSFDATLCVMSGSNSEDEAADKILEHCLDADIACSLAGEGTLNVRAAADALGQAQTENSQLAVAAIEKSPYKTDLLERIEDLTQMLDISAVALSELVCLKDLKDKHGKTDKYLERQPEAWKSAKSALTQIDHGPLFPLRERIEQLEAALKHYANQDSWRKVVIDSYSGECDFFDWDGDLADEPWGIASGALIAGEKRK